MSWTAPMTAIAGSVFTAAQFNQFVRDNLNECPTSKAFTPGAYFTVADANLMVQRTPQTAYIAASQTTTSQTFADLATIGPQVTVDTGSSALVGLYNANLNSTATVSSLMSFDVTGASTIAASDSTSIGTATSSGARTGSVFLVTGLTPGTNIFTCRYRVGSGTGTYVDRRITVFPL
jgi:hypothetical protein